MRAEVLSSRNNLDERRERRVILLSSRGDQQRRQQRRNADGLSGLVTTLSAVQWRERERGRKRETTREKVTVC